MGILNGTEMRNLDTNVLGGNETTYYFAAFCLCLSALFSISMAWMALGEHVSRAVEACS